MMVRPRLGRLRLLLVACALLAGCDAPERSLTRDHRASTPAEGVVEPRPTDAEPRRLADSPVMAGPLVTVGFRSRQPAETFEDPEVSLGPAVDSLAPNDRTADAGSKSTDRANLESQGAAPPLERLAGGPAEPLPPQVAGAALQPGGPAAHGSNSMERLPRVANRLRSAEMDAVARQAEGLVRIGFRLAERGAFYSARRNFFESLGLIARSLDVDQQTQVHSRALSAGRTALAEARQFGERGMAAEVDLARLVAVHRTPVLKHEGLDQLSPVIAQQRYYTYAQEQFALAAGGQRSAAVALYGLGKSAPQVQSGGADGSLAAVGEQVACYQAALLADERNYLVANELGVIFAENGRLEVARDLFERSLAISEQGATWQNLAVSLARLGDSAAASRAARRADELRGTRLANITGDNVRWVDPATFAKNGSPSDGLFPAPAVGASEPQPTAAAPQKKRVALLFPWQSNTRR